MNCKSTPKMTWLQKAAVIVASAPNEDWRMSTYTELPGEVDIPLTQPDINDGYKDKQFGVGKGVFFQWDDHEENFFLGFLVAEFDGVLEAVPVTNRKREWSEETKATAIYSVGNYITNRRCPKCAKFDKLHWTRNAVTCKNCRFKESTR